MSFTNGESFSTITSAIEKTSAKAEVVREATGLWRITWHYNDRIQRSFWVDSDRGFTPVNSILRRKAADAEDWLEPFEESHVTWEQHRDVWVPTDYMIQVKSKQKGVDGMAVRRYAFQIKWSSVNGEIPKERFVEQDFDVDTELDIVDRRSGEGVIVGRTDSKWRNRAP